MASEAEDVIKSETGRTGSALTIRRSKVAIIAETSNERDIAVCQAVAVHFLKSLWIVRAKNRDMQRDAPRMLCQFILYF